VSTKALATTGQAPEPAENHRISKRIRRACDALVSGDARTVTEAAERVNLSREHLSRYLSKPHIAEYLRQKACRALAIDAARAASVKGQLLNAGSEHVQNEVSTYLLALAGIKPAATPQVAVNVEIKAGYVIDLRDDAAPVISGQYVEHDLQDADKSKG